MKIQIINESREGHFYSHWTNLNGLIGILQSNELIGSNDGEHHLRNTTNISLSRLGNGSGIPNFIKKDGTIASVRIVLDIGKLEKRYKISPIEFFNDPRDRDAPTQRSTDDSEYEEAVVVGNTQKSVDITNSSGEFLGTVVIDFKTNKISKVLNSEGNKALPDKENKYELNGDLYKIKINKTSKGRFYGITLSNNSSDISIDEDEFKDYEKGSIKDIKKYITRVELADILFDSKKEYLVKSENGEYLSIEDCINQVLKDGNTSGLNNGNHQHTVRHNYLTLDKFLNFIEKELGKSKIRTYETPKSFYSIKGNKSKGEYTVVSDRESDNNLYLVQIKSKEKYRIDPYEYRLIPAISDRKAIQIAEDNFEFDDSVDSKDIKILPFNRLRHIENNKYQFIGLPKFVKLMDKKKNCKSYFEFIKVIVDLGVVDKMDIKIIYGYSEKSLSKKIKVDKDKLEIKVR